MLIETRGLTKNYGSVRSLNDVSIDIAGGEFVAITGASGSGKSTLLNLLGGLDRPSGGQYRFDGTDVTTLGDAALAKIRSREFGFVFQSYNLLARATALLNVELPMLYSPLERRARSSRASALLERVGLGNRLSHLPSELSGGEQQRVAIARALANGPSVIFADEPTGALDAESGASIIALFEALHREGLTIILVTHDEAIARRAGRRLTFVDGALKHAEPPSLGGATRSHAAMTGIDAR